MDKIGLEGVGSRQRKDSESAAEISRMGIRAEVGWSIWREQVTGLAERILLRISMKDVLPRMARIPHKGVQLSLLHQPNCYSSPQNAKHTETSAERDSHGWHGWTQMLGCAGIEQRIKPIERVPAAWDFQQRIEPIERIL